MRALLLSLVLVGFCQVAHADGISSVYTDLDSQNCVTYAQAEEGDGDWAELACSGYRGYPVLIAYDDARESLFYGFPPGGDMNLVWESFSGLNSSGAKVEWRIDTKGNVAVPFAVIHRRSISNLEDENKPTEVLLVAKVAQMEARDGCTIGLVLATGNPQANDQARKLADEKAKTFACGKDKRTVIGNVPAFGRVDN